MLRSLLYVPGNRPDLAEKALAGTADAVILDLEDAVPIAAKPAARSSVSQFALAAAEAEKRLCVRINSGQLGMEDMASLLDAHVPFDVLLLAKAESPEWTSALAAMLDAAVSNTGRSGREVELQPVIESVVGLETMVAIAKSSRRIRRFSFGGGDYVIDIRGRATPSRIETLFARATVVERSRLLGLDAPISHVFVDFHDLVGLEQASHEDRALGYGGRSCIHPRQVDVINRVFGIDASELAQARAIIAKAERLSAEGKGAFQLEDGTFVDEAVVRRARLLIESSYG